jgi:hypothetical protein
VDKTTFNNKGPKGRSSSPPMIRATLAYILWLPQEGTVLRHPTPFRPTYRQTFLAEMS